MRGRSSIITFVLAFVLLLSATPLIYAASVLRDEDRFVTVSTAVIRRPEVRSFIADRVAELTITAIELDETLAGALPPTVRPLSVPLARIGARELASATLRVLDTQVAEQLFDVALREVHRQLTATDGDVVIDLRAVLVRAAREIGGPALGYTVADLVATSDLGRFVVFESDDAGDTPVVTVVRTTHLVGLVLLASSIAAFVTSIATAQRRRRRVFDVGVAVAAASLTSVLVVDLATGLVTDDPVGRAVADALVSHYVASTTGLLALGLAVAVGAALLRVDTVVLVRDLGAARRGDRVAGGRVVQALATRGALARCAIWTALVVTLQWWDQPTGRAVITLVGAAAIAQAAVWSVTSVSSRAVRLRSSVTLEPTWSAPGIPYGRLRVELLGAAVLALVLWPSWSTGVVVDLVVAAVVAQLLVDAVPATRRRLGERSRSDVSAPRTAGRWSLVAAVAAGSTIFTVGTIGTASAVDDTEEQAGCNGSIELCDRRIDEVTFAGSHNSMSSTELGWQLAMQTGDIVAQLDHGVRALLIDTHYWASTATGTVEGADDDVAADVIAAALADDEPHAGTWLCHGFCALGATDLTAALADIRFWLEGNPNEVVLMVIQDAISPEDTAVAFEASGLVEFVHRHEPGTPFPTLGELVASGERLLVYAEEQGSPDSWYQNAFADTFTETPFTFDVATDFTCDPNRGREDHPLFLINHWVTTGIPVRDVAKRVNSMTSLQQRVDRCLEERGRFPTVIAVDFVETGDLVEFVADLNRRRLEDR